MDLVVFVPFVALLNAVVIAWFPGNVSALGNDLLGLGLFFVHDVCELHFILLQTLFLNFLEHFKTRVVEPQIIYDVESYPRV